MNLHILIKAICFAATIAEYIAFLIIDAIGILESMI